MQDEPMTQDTALTPQTADPTDMWKMATAVAKADIIPAQFRNNTANVFVAMDMANRLGVGMMEVMQNTFVVHGTPGFSAKYVIGMCNQRGPFKGPIHFDYTADKTNPSVTAWAIVRETEQRVEFTVDIAMAKAEGWTKNPKYKTMTQAMLSYRSGVLLVRLYAPETMLGLQTKEELQDVAASGAQQRSAVDMEFVVRDSAAPAIEAPVDPDNAPDDLSYKPADAAIETLARYGEEA